MVEVGFREGFRKTVDSRESNLEPRNGVVEHPSYNHPACYYSYIDISIKTKDLFYVISYSDALCAPHV